LIVDISNGPSDSLPKSHSFNQYVFHALVEAWVASCSNGFE